MERATVQGAKYVWLLPDENKKQIADIASAYNLSFPIAQTLLTRGFTDRTLIDEFLFSSYEKDVADPRLMKDLEKAVDRIERAIQNNEKILIFGDYDVDGITSSALMMISLLPLNAQVNFFLPHRVRDGYGLSTKIVERAADNGYTVIITVDNGITAFEPAIKAKERGIDLIITDHHRPHDHVPEAYALVNPNQDDCGYPFKVFAGVGVAFKLLSLLYQRLGQDMPSKAYELLLLGTIADVVPLKGENRFWVRYGLSYINKVESLSFKALKSNGKLDKELISATDIGFSIAPQINALGRLEDPRKGVKFLIGSDPKEVKEVAQVLLELNEARKAIERSIYQDVVKQVESGVVNPDADDVIVACGTSWPPGVIGLVASRLVSTYGKPTILLHITDKGIAKGSCRSIPEFNMFNALDTSRDILDQFGGHSLAAGLSLKAENVPILKERLSRMIKEQLTAFDLSQKITLDAHVCLSDLTSKFVSDMRHLEPFGHENKSPIFYVQDVVLVQKPKILKESHIKCMVFADGVVKPVIFFNRPELYDLLVMYGQEPFSIAAQVNENNWNGRVSVELTGLDVVLK